MDGRNYDTIRDTSGAFVPPKGNVHNSRDRGIKWNEFPSLYRGSRQEGAPEGVKA